MHVKDFSLDVTAMMATGNFLKKLCNEITPSFMFLILKDITFDNTEVLFYRF